MRDQLHNEIMTSLSTILDQRMLQAAGVEIDTTLIYADVADSSVKASHKKYIT